MRSRCRSAGTTGHGGGCARSRSSTTCRSPPSWSPAGCRREHAWSTAIRHSTSLYPLDRALRQVELGGLILAVHDLQPLVGREGFYVVSSVRGTAEFLKTYPPRPRPVNPEVVVFDVAFQPGSNMMQGGKYDRIVMGSASRDGVEFSWWLVVPRRFFKVKDGKRVYLPENDQSAMPGEPGRLDDLPGTARVPLSATYWDEKHRDANGAQQDVSTWAEVPLAPDRPPGTLEEVAARARDDLLMMGVGGAGGLLGVAADAKAAPNTLRPLSHFSQETVSDADFAAAVRRGLDDCGQFDEVRDVRPEDMLPPGAGGHVTLTRMAVWSRGDRITLPGSHPIRMITRADERPAGDVGEAQLQRQSAELVELVGRDVADHGKVF